MSLADHVLRGVVALLPASRREWGQAMRAELTGIDGRAERRSFVAGCLRTALRTSPGLSLGAIAVLVPLAAVVVAPARPLVVGYVVFTVAGIALAALSPQRRGDCRTGVATGVAAVGVAGWTAAVLIFPPIPATALIAAVMVVVVAVMTATVVGTAARQRSVLVALSTATMGTVVSVVLLAGYAPIRFISLVGVDPGPLTPTSRIAQSRVEVADPYMVLLFIGVATTLALVAVSWPRRYDEVQQTASPRR